jgi:DNA-binding PadR family transcriptional regulator
MSPRKHRGRRYRPYAITEQGVAMLSSVLRSSRAVEVNIAIMRTFVQLRRLMDSNRDLARKIEALEKKYDEQFSPSVVVFGVESKFFNESE